MNRPRDISTCCSDGVLVQEKITDRRFVPGEFSRTGTLKTGKPFAVAIEVGRRGVPFEATPRPLVICPQSRRGRPSESFGRVQHICTAMFTTFTRTDQICDLQARGLRFTADIPAE